MQQDISSKNIDSVSFQEERPHHPTSPSKLQSLEQCPCYDNHEPETQHEMTVRGTAQHNVVESGKIPEDMSDEDAAMAMERRQYIEERVAFLLEQHGNVKMVTEEYYPIDDKHNEDKNGVSFTGTTAGYLDCALIFDSLTKAELHDWKFGRWAVEPASNNLQGMAYALGLCKKFPKLETVTVFFHVPRVSSTPDSYTFNRKYLEESVRERIEAVVSRTVAARRTGDWKMARPNYPTCAFCAKIADCPAVGERISTVAQKYSPIDVPTDINPLHVLSKEDQTAAMRLAHLVGAWAIAFKNRVKDRILEGKGKCPEDFILVSYVEREVADVEKLEAVASKFITKRKWYELKRALVPTLTQIEKALRLRTARGQKDSRVEKLSEALLESGAVVKTQPIAFLRAKRSSQNTSSKPEEKGN